MTIGHTTHKVPEPFLVLATQNPIESEGTYPLPEAQVDRFMLKVLVDYPQHDEELTVVLRSLEPAPQLQPVLTLEGLTALQQLTSKVFVDPALVSWVVDLATATRKPTEVGLDVIAPYVSYGASPRGPISVIAAARALAVIRQRDYVLPSDVEALVRDAFRHRLVLSYQSLAEGVPRTGPRPRARLDPGAADRPRARCHRRGVKGLIAATGRVRTPAQPGPGAITAESLEALELAIGRRVDGLLAGDFRSSFAGVGPSSIRSARTRPVTTCAGSTGT